MTSRFLHVRKVGSNRTTTMRGKKNHVSTNLEGKRMLYYVTHRTN